MMDIQTSIGFLLVVVCFVYQWRINNSQIGINSSSMKLANSQLKLNETICEEIRILMRSKTK